MLRFSRSVRVFGLCALAFLGAVSGLGCSSNDELEQDVEALQKQVAELQAVLSPTPVPVAAYKQFGFSLPLPQGVNVQSAGLGGASAASNDQGQLTSSAGGVTMVLIWTKQKLEPAQAVQGAFEVLRSAQPRLAFQPVGQGEVKVDGQSGVYGAFGALEGQQIVSVGAIGAWSCTNGRSFTITVAGANQTAVEASFQGFSSGFKCAA